MALSLGLAGVLNNVTAARSGKGSLAKIDRIQLIPLKQLKSHPDNFYQISDIESLAKLILFNKEIDTLTVKANPSGNDYTVISGHRRMAAVTWLVEHGEITEDEAKLPCKIISKLSTDIFTEDEAEQFKIIAGNIGQRKYSTADLVQEITRTEPLAKKIYNNLPDNEKAAYCDFREYFAKVFFSKSSAWLQRLKSFTHLTSQAMEMVENGEISATAAAVLATLDTEQQAEYINKLVHGEISNTVSAIQDFKKATTDAAEELTEQSQNSDEESVCISSDEEPDCVSSDEVSNDVAEPTEATESNEENSARDDNADLDEFQPDIPGEIECKADPPAGEPEPTDTSQGPITPAEEKLKDATKSQLLSRLSSIYSDISFMQAAPKPESYNFNALMNRVREVIELLKND